MAYHLESPEVIRARLHEMLVNWREEIEAIIPETNPDYEFWQ